MTFARYLNVNVPKTRVTLELIYTKHPDTKDFDLDINFLSQRFVWIHIYTHIMVD